ncbi:hypothetical protein ASPBRDRAFT_44815 [Aspergillus brasiliensis CBS 101740]|uniref:Uncharacterized protein n=1 Tax=Aspergillus brasiliensis (strain CBS 101740 / IMI 381727 / IBT 21946) TaxID=767769 RepID=A0A1L9UG12_ASPBC|nr:hypothetical protein ASPBRDRAFT_44815 [Aspergillus brasiliensis CBS 101740]
MHHQRAEVIGLGQKLWTIERNPRGQTKVQLTERGTDRKTAEPKCPHDMLADKERTSKLYWNVAHDQAAESQRSPPTGVAPMVDKWEFSILSTDRSLWSCGVNPMSDLTEEGGDKGEEVVASDEGKVTRMYKYRPLGNSGSGSAEKERRKIKQSNNEIRIK